MLEYFETSRSDGVRQVNRARVMRLIQDKSGIDRTELASLIGVSNAAITNIVNELIVADIVQETISSGDSVARGRKRVGLQNGPRPLATISPCTTAMLIIACSELDLVSTFRSNVKFRLKR